MFMYRNGLIKPIKRALHDEEEDEKDEDKRNQFELSFSSETPVMRWFGNEVLSHEDGDVQLKRISNGGPVLVDHHGDQVGVIRSADIAKKRGTAIIEFGFGKRSQEIEADVAGGIRQNISVGYRVNAMEKVSEKKGINTYRVTDWEPMEISIVSTPADTSVGIGRSLETLDDEQVEEQERYIESLKQLVRAADDEYNKRSDENQEAEKKELETRSSSKKQITHIRGSQMSESVIDPAELEAKIAKTVDEQRRGELKKLNNLNKQLGGGLGDVILEGKEAGRSFDEIMGSMVEEQNKRSDAALAKHERGGENSNSGLSTVESQEYSVANAIRHLMDPSKHKAGLEREVSEHYMRQNGDMPFQGGGIIIPTNIGTRTMTVGVPADGGLTVATEKMPMIEQLKNMTVLNQTAMRRIPGARGNLSFPRKITASTAAFLAETATITPSNPTFDEVTMSPKRIGADVRYSKQLFLQSNESIEGIVRTDINEELAIQVDSAGLQGSGTGSNPEGIVNTTGVNSLTFAGAATWQDVVEFETLVASDNALDGQLLYVTTPAVRGKWKGIEKATNTAQFLWPETGSTVNGYGAIVSNQIASNKVIFGNWRELMFAEWGAIELIVDPVTLASDGLVKVVANYFIDFGVRHPVSFAVSSDSGAQ